LSTPYGKHKPLVLHRFSSGTSLKIRFDCAKQSHFLLRTPGILVQPGIEVISDHKIWLPL
ncbi:MAG TPA: hypothetical protein P5102_13075, partial [Candidatus Competibacteraceae bacterium]|nr:hypothetical protein [Candidatus Competibacteraceae bacterium]